MQQHQSFSSSIKMRVVLIFALCFLFFESVYSQPIFGYRYLNTPSSNSSTESEIFKHFDGGIVGINIGTSSSNFTLFKLSAHGNMEWKKQLVFPFPNVSASSKNNFIALNDSNFVVIKEVGGSVNFDFVAVKFDNFGNVIWAKSYWGMNNSNGHYMTPFGQQGFVVSDNHQIAFIDENGNVKASFLFSNLIEIKGLISINTYKIKVFGDTWIGENLALFDIDTTGNITNSVEYSLSGDSLVFGMEQITKASNGGTYSLSNLDDICNGPTALGVFHFDSLNQLVWAKKISCAGQFPSNIISADNGCMISANHNLAPNNSVPMIYKLDSTGSLEWMKMPGDPSIPMFNYGWVSSIIPDSSNGWYCVMKKNNLHFFHLDSVLNGLCTSQDYSQTVVNIICTGNSFLSTDSLVYMTDSLFETTQFASSWFQYDVCTGVLVDSLSEVSENLQNIYILKIFPNPANSQIKVTLPNSNAFDLEVYDMASKLVYKNHEQPSKNEIVISTIDFADGLYLLRYMQRERSGSSKFVIQH